jgi:NADH dehydrogenase [ubiquinone] 1 alpha subcomplex assembly factor 7
MGLEMRASRLLRTASQEQARALMGGVRRLVDPSQMGALFKVMVLGKGLSTPPPPFA